MKTRNRLGLVLILLIPLAATLAVPTTARSAPPLAEPARVAAIARMLPEKPGGLGRPIADRAAWADFATPATRQKIVEEADRLLKTSLPPMTDELFLDFSQTGNRRPWEKVASNRRSRLPVLVLAECIQNKGRITDNDSKNGSSARSLPIPVTAPGRYVLKGKYLNLSGRGLALYIRPLDHEGNVLGADTSNYRRAIGSLGDGVGSTSWQAFAFPFDVPAASEAVFLWIHSISTARVDGCLDDIEIVRDEAGSAKSQNTETE